MRALVSVALFFVGTADRPGHRIAAPTTNHVSLWRATLTAPVAAEMDPSM